MNKCSVFVSSSIPVMPTTAMDDPSSLQLLYLPLFDGQTGEGDGDGFPDFRPSSLPTRRDSFSSLPPRRRDSDAFLGFLPPGERLRRDSNTSLFSIPHSFGGARHVVVPNTDFLVCYFV